MSNEVGVNDINRVHALYAAVPGTAAAERATTYPAIYGPNCEITASELSAYMGPGDRFTARSAALLAADRALLLVDDEQVRDRCEAAVAAVRGGNLDAMHGARERLPFHEDLLTWRAVEACAAAINAAMAVDDHTAVDAACVAISRASDAAAIAATRAEVHLPHLVDCEYNAEQVRLQGVQDSAYVAEVLAINTRASGAIGAAVMTQAAAFTRPMIQWSTAAEPQPPATDPIGGSLTIVNLTANPIVLRTADGDVTIPVSGAVAEVASVPGALHHDTALPVPVADPPTLGEVSGIPDAVPGTVYIVSGMVLAATSRPDVFGPGTGPKDGPVRDATGRIIAVTRLIAARGRYTGGVLVGNV